MRKNENLDISVNIRFSSLNESSFIPFNDLASLYAMSAMPIFLMEMCLRATEFVRCCDVSRARMHVWREREKDRGERGKEKRKMKKKSTQNKDPYTVIRAENRPDDRPVTVGAVSDALAE